MRAKMKGMGGRFVGALAALAALALAAGIAQGEVIDLNKMRVVVGGNVKPKRLPAKRMAPVALRLHYRAKMTDGSVPPALARMQLDFDRDGRMDQRGLPSCREGQLANASTNQALARCRRGLVGRGEARAIIDLPDQDPFPARGRLLAFNGGRRGGARIVLLHTNVRAPVPTAIVAVARVTRSPRRGFRHRMTVAIPEIAGGNGSLVAFNLELKRRWTHKRKRRSFIYARCSQGSLQVHGDLRWGNGDLVNGLIIRTCRKR